MLARGEFAFGVAREAHDGGRALRDGDRDVAALLPARAGLAAEYRRALIEAARAVFAEDGLAAPLSAVAKRAGVGQGSLYRHFPDRIGLAVAVFEEHITELEALAAGPAATLIELTASARHDPRAERLQIRIAGLIELLLARDQAAGRVRDTVEPADVLVAISMLTVFLPRADPSERAEVATRARAIFRAAFLR